MVKNEGLTMNQLAEINAQYVTTIAALEAKCAALAAENAGLNEKMNKLATWPGIEFYSSAWEFNNGDGNDALEFMCDVQTPATGTFLDEVRAEGVDMAIKAAMPEVASEFQRETFEQCVSATVRYPQSDLAGKVEMVAWLELFADQLRK